jgi:hypothetical protein
MAASEDECGASVEDVEKIIRVVLVGSRLKPVPWMADQSPSVLVLAVDLHCFGDGTLKNYDINVEFVRWSKEHRAPVAHLERYGFFGRGDEEDILNALEEGVERAVTEYIEVNFDPQPE